MCASLLLVSACGGGGGDTPASRPPSAAQGLWTGSTTSSRTLKGLVFGDGTYYVFYSPAGLPTAVAGVVQGTSGTGTGIWSSTDGVDFNLEADIPSILPATMSAGFVAKKSFEGTIAYASGAKTTFTAAYDTAYETVPSLAALAGSYTGQTGLSTGVKTAKVTVTTGGGITGTITIDKASTCAFSGTATPRTDGNAYDIALSLDDAPCPTPKLRVAGIAYFDTAAKKLYLAAPNAARTDGVLFLGTKP
ncbi:MAG TPA: hypothetical protein VFL86_18830 [Burkholderiaceae bacterium]|nr:hypothetical protein [Burkholderiaceae bacterium]